MLRREKDRNTKDNFKTISGMDITVEQVAANAAEEARKTKESDAAAFAQLDKIAETLRNPPYSPPCSPKAVIGLLIMKITYHKDLI